MVSDTLGNVHAGQRDLSLIHAKGGMASALVHLPQETVRASEWQVADESNPFTVSVWQWMPVGSLGAQTGEERMLTCGNGETQMRLEATDGDTYQPYDDHVIKTTEIVVPHTSMENRLYWQLFDLHQRRYLLNALCNHWMVQTYRCTGIYKSVIQGIVTTIRDSLYIRLEQLLLECYNGIRLDSKTEETQAEALHRTEVQRMYDTSKLVTYNTVTNPRTMHPTNGVAARGCYGMAVEGPTGSGKSHLLCALSRSAPWLRSNQVFGYDAANQRFYVDTHPLDASVCERDGSVASNCLHRIKLSDYLYIGKPILSDTIQHRCHWRQEVYYRQHCFDSLLHMAQPDVDHASFSPLLAESLEATLWAITSEARCRQALFRDWLKAYSCLNEAAAAVCHCPSNSVTVERAITAGGAVLVALEDVEVLATFSRAHSAYSGVSTYALITQLLLNYQRIWAIENLAVFLFLPISTTTKLNASIGHAPHEATPHATVEASELFIQFAEKHYVLDTLLDEVDRSSVLKDSG